MKESECTDQLMDKSRGWRIGGWEDPSISDPKQGENRLTDGSLSIHPQGWLSCQLIQPCSAPDMRGERCLSVRAGPLPHFCRPKGAKRRPSIRCPWPAHLRRGDIWALAGIHNREWRWCSQCLRRRARAPCGWDSSGGTRCLGRTSPGDRGGARVKGGWNLAVLTCPGTLHLSLSLSRPLAHFAFLCPLHVHQCVYLYLCLSWPLFTLPLFSVHLFISLMCLSHLLSQSLSACAGMFAPYTVLYFRLPGLTLSTFSFLSSPGPFPSTSPLPFPNLPSISSWTN